MGVKSVDWEGPLSQLLATAGCGRGSLHEPVAHLSTLCALVLAALSATRLAPTLPLERPSSSLVPLEWTRREFNLHYSGALSTLPPQSHIGTSSEFEQLGFLRATTLSKSEAAAAESSFVMVSENECGICFDERERDSAANIRLECGHSFCLRCLLHYLLLAAKNPPGHVLQCPVCQPLDKQISGLQDPVQQPLIESVLSKEEYQRVGLRTRIFRN